MNARLALPVLALAAGLAANLAAGPRPAGAADAPQLLREALLQQSPAERAACVAIRRTLAAGFGAAQVVRTAVEIGHNPCAAIRCVLTGVPGGPAAVDAQTCRAVVEGAVAAGVFTDVVARCAEGCDPAVLAAALADATLDPNYCYVGLRAPGAPPAAPPPAPVIDRSLPRPQTSPYSFPARP